MKSSNNAKPRSTTSPKNKKNATKDREKEKMERRRSENYVSPGTGTGKMEPAELISFLMGESAAPKQYARLSRESVLNYADQTLFENISYEVSYSLAEDLSYKLRQIIHDAQIKANVSGRTALMGSDIEASFENLGIEKVYGTSNNATFIPLTDKHLYLDDSLVNLVEIAEGTSTVIQPGDTLLTNECYPPVEDNMKNYTRYFDTMCRALICTTPKLQQEALRDIQRNAHIGAIVNWFYHFGYFLLSKDITYVSLTLSALRLIEALERNPIARQLVGEKELKLLLRLILQRLLRTRTDYDVIKPMCSALATLCRRAPLRDLVVAKIAQRRQEFNTEYALPLVCIINALGITTLQVFVDHLLNIFVAARDEIGAGNIDLLTAALLRCYQSLCTSQVITTKQHWAFYTVFEHSLIPFWSLNCTHTVQKPETNWRNIIAQLLRTRRKMLSAKRRVKYLDVREVFDIVGTQQFIQFKTNSIPKRGHGHFMDSIDTAKTNGRHRIETVLIGRWSTYREWGEKSREVKTCLGYLNMIL